MFTQTRRPVKRTRQPRCSTRTSCVLFSATQPIPRPFPHPFAAGLVADPTDAVELARLEAEAAYTARTGRPTRPEAPLTAAEMRRIDSARRDGEAEGQAMGCSPDLIAHMGEEAAETEWQNVMFSRTLNRLDARYGERASGRKPYTEADLRWAARTSPLNDDGYEGEEASDDEIEWAARQAEWNERVEMGVVG